MKVKFFICLLLLGLGITVLAGCGNNLATVGTVETWQDPPEINRGQELANVNRASGGMVPATANLTSADLEAAIKNKNGWQLIDIREPREFAVGHIETAVNIPLGDLEKNLANVSRDKEIVLIDLNGTRSGSACSTLVKLGYDEAKIKILAGGMQQWTGNGSSGGSQESPKPEVKESTGGC